MSWSSHGHAACPPGPLTAPTAPTPAPCLSGGCPSTLWSSAHMATPGGPILVASSSPNSGCGGTGVIPSTLPCGGVLLAAVATPGLRSPVFPTQKPPGLPWGPEPPTQADPQSPPRPQQLGTGPHRGPMGMVCTATIPGLPGEGRRFWQDTLPWWPQGSLPRTAAGDRSGSVSLMPAPPPWFSRRK